MYRMVGSTVETFYKLPKQDPAFSIFNNFTSAGEWPSLQVLSMFITLKITSKKSTSRKESHSSLIHYCSLPSVPTAGSANNSVLKLDPTFFTTPEEFVWILKDGDHVFNMFWPLWLEMFNITSKHRRLIVQWGSNEKHSAFLWPLISFVRSPARAKSWNWLAIFKIELL